MYDTNMSQEIICEACGLPTPRARRNGHFQKFCPTCAKQRTKEAKIRWNREHNTPERKAIIAKSIRERTPEQRDKFNAGQRKIFARLKREVVAGYGGECSCCGESEIKFLSVDHVNRDGSEHRKRYGARGAPFYRWIKRSNFPTTLRILCYNCNCAIGFSGYCPHQTEKRVLSCNK